MLWKEGVTGFRSTRDMVLVACFLAFGPGGLYLTMAWTDGMPVELATAVIRFLWILVVLPICVMTAMRAGGAVRSEMDQRTMEGLLATPLTIREILRAKWLAALVYPRVEYLFLGVFLGVGVLGGGLHPLMLPVVVLVFTIFASFTTSLGLVIGLLARSTSRTHFWTLISVVCLLAGAPSWTYWFLGPQRSDCSMSTPTAFALTPAAVLWDIIWNGPFPKLGSSRESTFALINVALHAAAAYALWRYALHAFLRTSGRTDHGGEVMKILEKGA